MRVALDTNVLFYLEGDDDRSRRQAARSILATLDPAEIILPVQVLGELYRVLRRKGGRSAEAARGAISTWRSTFKSTVLSDDGFFGAVDLATVHQLQIWDAVILATAAEADCILLLSEDLQDGFVWHGVTVANPFAMKQHPLLRSVLERP